MCTLVYDSANDQEQSVTNLVKTHSLLYLLEQDRQQLSTQSRHISYYHPNIDRDQAEQFLKTKYLLNKKFDGLFLLRDCTTSQYDFSLSLIFQEKFYHYKIQLIYDIYFSIDAGPQIAGIESLIHYYQERADGLICTLSNEFVQGQPPPITVRSKGATNILHRACKQGSFEIVKSLLSSEYIFQRPDVNGKDSYGSTALHEACYFGHDDVVRLLLKAGCYVFARDANGATALHRAAAGNRPSTLLILINEGLADYEERNYTNCWVPLHEAVFYNSAACVQVLLDCGAPLRPRTDQGKTPLQIAEDMKSDECLLILRSYRIPPAKSCRMDWFHNQLKFDRFAAKELIESVKDGPRNGMFVVRYSSKNAKNYALTVYNEKEFFNFEIVRLDETTFYIDDGPYFDSLEHLIDHYCRISDGFPTTLTCSINQFRDIVQSRVQPFAISSRTKDMLMPLKQNFHHQKNVDETKIMNRNIPTQSSKFPSSSLSSSITSLNSFSSLSRASSTQDSPLSTSSSSASLSSNSPSKQVAEENPLKLQKTTVDRRKIVGGKIKPYTPEFPHDENKRLVVPIVILERQQSLKLNLIPSNQIQQTAKLGEGEFGEVYEGFYQENSAAIPVAIKVLKDYSYSTKQDFLREAEYMSKLSHHCICKLYGIVDSNDYLWKHQLTISEYRLKLWASQIADGMEYMEYKGIVHRDLAARNILLQSTDQVKISDFGLSRCIDTDVYVQKSDSKIPVKWYAPEAISIGKFTSKSDVWSFGITLWEMFSYAATPYGDMSGSDVYYALKHGKRLERPSRCPQFIYQIMLECWEWEEKNRPTFYQLVDLLKNNSNSRQIVRKSLLIDDNLNNSKAHEQYSINGNDQECKTIVQF